MGAACGAICRPDTCMMLPRLFRWSRDKAMFKRLVISCAALLCLSIAAQAAQRVALVIGNSAYKEATELDNPGNDASDFAAVLTKYGFEVVLGLNLDKPGFETKVRQFAQALRGADAGAFFY